MNRARFVLAPLSAAVLLATGCSGAPGSSNNDVTPLAQPARVKHGSAVLRVLIPKHRRRSEHYVSPGTASIKIMQNGKSLGTFNTSANSGGCTPEASGILCTFPIAPKIGKNQLFTIKGFSGGSGSGAVLSSGSTTVTVDRDASTTIAVTMGGQVAALSIGLPGATLPAGTAGSQPLVIEAKDAAGYTIVGAAKYTSAITVSDGDGTGITGLSLNGATAAASVIVKAPSDTIALAYNGKNLGFAALNATTTPPGGSAIGAPRAYFAPSPTLVNTVGTTLANVNSYAAAPTPDNATHSYWFAVQNDTSNNYEMIAMAPNGTVTTYTAGTAPSTNLPSCQINSIKANGPNNAVWFVSGCNPGQWGFMNPSTGVTTSFTASGSYANFGGISGSQSGDAAIYATIYSYGANNWGTVRADASGNFAPTLFDGNSNAGPLVGSSIYQPEGSTLGRLTIGGSGPSATLTAGGTTNFLLNTIENPAAAADGSLWDGLNCAITHVVPATPFSSTKATYYNAPSAICTSVGLSFDNDPIVAPDGSIWVTASTGGCEGIRANTQRGPEACCCAIRAPRQTTDAGTIFGTLGTVDPANAPFSTGNLTQVTVGGTTVPFFPYAGFVAADGNLAYLGEWESNNTLTFYAVELAY